MRVFCTNCLAAYTPYAKERISRNICSSIFLLDLSQDFRKTNLDSIFFICGSPYTSFLNSLNWTCTPEMNSALLKQAPFHHYHRFCWYATLENKTPGETFPNFPSVLRVIDRSDQFIFCDSYVNNPRVIASLAKFPSVFKLIKSAKVLKRHF